MESKIIDHLQEICNGIPYTRSVPKEAEKLAKEHGCVIIVGGSDDLMYCYGANSYLTEYCEHSEGWDGCDLATEAGREALREEAKQLGLKIFWCGSILSTKEQVKGYDIKESGAFSYQLKEGIEHRHFKVLERENDNDVYCTGIIIKLPESFKPQNK